MIPYDKIRVHYENIMPYMIQAARLGPGMWTSPYSKHIDWMQIFSPIEFDLWQSIRGRNYIPLYPQYPVGKYFADFGNPILKVAVECDGKEFHLDKEKDAIRDKEFKKMGWEVYRLPGNVCVKIVDLAELDDEDYYVALMEYYKSGEGLLKAIGVKYGCCKNLVEGELNLINHCLSRFCTT